MRPRGSPPSTRSGLPTGRVDDGCDDESELRQDHRGGTARGFQSEPATIPTSDKVELIEALAETGLTEISCCSFVNAAQVPQMADAEQVVARLHRRPGVRYTGLWLNVKGFERAQA